LREEQFRVLFLNSWRDDVRGIPRPQPCKIRRARRGLGMTRSWELRLLGG
jgi:hypothetical protein